MQEAWKDIVGYEDYYEVSNLGNIRRKEITIERKNGSKIHLPQRPIKIVPYYGKSPIPRYRVNLIYNGVKRVISVHRAVAMAFIPNPNNYPQVNHKDEDPSNNNVDNLEWCSPKYNHNYGTRNSRHAENLKKKVNVYDTNNNFIKQYNSIKEAAQELNVDASGITKVCKHKYKTCGSYIFEYA